MTNTKISLSNEILKDVKRLADLNTSSTARYGTYDAFGNALFSDACVCFHQIASNAAKAQTLAIAYQGYGGFKSGDPLRPAYEADLYCTLDYPFVNIGKGTYNEVSLKWLEAILDPEGPFGSLLPLMYETNPLDVQRTQGFIFPDVSLIPPHLTWCFAICSRLGFANARVVWRYLHMREKGLPNNLSLLIASGFEHEVKNGEVTGQIIKSYTGGFLGPDVTAFAGRFLSAKPAKEKPFKGNKAGTYGSADVFRSGKLDLKNLRFPSWEAVIEYVTKRGEEQAKEIKKAA